MDALLASYGITENTLLPFLRRESVLLAGSAALALYLKQEGMEAGFEPGDLDLWVSGMDLDTEEELVSRLCEAGFSVSRVAKEVDLYMERITRIQQVLTLTSVPPLSPPKKIQVIRVASEDLKDYVVNHFDWSVCMTWWCLESERFTTIYPRLTREKKMFLNQTLLSQVHSVRTKERQEKYVQRGFEVVEAPPPSCPFWDVPDGRSEEDLVAWEGVSAFDVLAYEDVSAIDHLRGGEWNILLGCGDAWYAFERRALIGYMRDHRHIHLVDCGRVTLYETPFRQYVGHDGWDSLAYSDDSVYRLVDGRVYGNKTVYTLETYSVRGWQEGIPSQQLSAFGLIELDLEDPFRNENEEEIEEVDEHELQMILSEELSVPLPPVVPAPVPASEVNEPAYQENDLYREILAWVNAFEANESIPNSM